MASVVEKFHQHFVPSRRNAYHPRLLRRGWLLFFLAVILLTEGFLVSSIVARQTPQTYLAAAAGSNITSHTSTYARFFADIFDNPGPPTMLVLGVVGILLAVVLFSTFFIHIEVQPARLVAAGVLVAALAFSFIALNVQLLSAGDSLLAAPAAAGYR